MLDMMLPVLSGLVFVQVTTAPSDRQAPAPVAEQTSTDIDAEEEQDAPPARPARRLPPLMMPPLPPVQGMPTPVLPPTPSTTASPSAAAAVQGAAKPSFRPINHDEDYSTLRDAVAADLWARLKHIPLAGSSYATIGGELRLRPELRIGERWGRGAQDENGNFQQRTRLWADVQIEGAVRAFVDIEHATSHGLDSVTTPVDEGRADFHQAFVEGRVQAGDMRFTARLGRQEIGLGNFAVFDMREGANTRRSLDLLRLMASSGGWDAGFLVGHAVREDPASFNDATNRDYAVTGAHLGMTIGEGTPSARAEMLYVSSRRTRAVFDTAPPARDNRHTLSLRYAGRADAWAYDAEAIGQWGRFGDLDIRAYYLSGTLSHGWQGGWRPRLALRADIGSGDGDSTDSRIGTYGQLFPRPLTYNGDLGPQNMTLLQPTLTLQPAPTFSLDFATARLWRTSTHDAVYALSGQVLRSGTESDSRFIGQRFVVAGRAALNPFTTVGFYTNYTTAGDVFRDSGTARDLFYAASYVTFRF